MTRFLRRCLSISLACSLVTGLGYAVSCASAPSTVVTQAGRNAFVADQVVTRIREVQKTIIDANLATPQGVSDDFAIPAVEFIKAALTSIGQVPNGWRPVVKTTYDTFKSRLSPDVQTKYRAYLLLIEALLA